MKLDGVRSYIRSRGERPEEVTSRRDATSEAARRRSQSAGEDSGSSPRELLNRLKEADLNPRKRAKLGARIDNFLGDNGAKRPEGKGVNLRQTVNRIGQSDLSDGEKRELITRIHDHVAGQKPEAGSRPNSSGETGGPSGAQAQVTRPSITIA